MGGKGWILQATSNVLMSNNRNVPVMLYFCRADYVIPVSVSYNNGDNIRTSFFGGLPCEVSHTRWCIDQHGIAGNGIYHEVGVGGNRAGREWIDAKRHGFLL
jgi:hypothetical protein